MDLSVGDLVWDRELNIEHEIRGIIDGLYIVRYDSPKYPGEWAYQIVKSFHFRLGLFATQPFDRAKE